MPLLNMAGPGALWFRSTMLWRAGKRRRARFLKFLIFVVYRAVLPPEAELAEVVRLGHYGLGVVVHPNVRLGRNVMLWHGVTLSVSDSPGSRSLLTVGNNVEIGAHAVVITRLKSSLVVTDNVRIGANAVVSKDIKQPGSYGGIPARSLGRTAGGDA